VQVLLCISVAYMTTLVCMRQRPCQQVQRARCMCGHCGAPAVVAFSGKRQWVELLNAGRPRAEWVKTVPLGPQQERPNVRRIRFVDIALACYSLGCMRSGPSHLMSMMKCMDL